MIIFVHSKTHLVLFSSPSSKQITALVHVFGAFECLYLFIYLYMYLFIYFKYHIKYHVVFVLGVRGASAGMHKKMLLADLPLMSLFLSVSEPSMYFLVRCVCAHISA